MARAARGLAGELRGQIDRAAEAGRWSLVLVAALAVGREGLETALFLWAATQTATGVHTVSTVPAWQPITGAVLGLATAVALGYLLYRGAVRINLTKFFTWTGAFLIVVAAGVLGYGFHDLQEAGILPGLNSPGLRRLLARRRGQLVRRAAQGRLQLLAADHLAPGGRLDGVPRRSR